MKVLKFGGTSVGSVESILNVKNIVEACNEPVAVVVSALGGITDQLIQTSYQAKAGDAKYIDSYNDMVERHHAMIESVIKDGVQKSALLYAVDGLLSDLKSIYHGVYLIKDLSEKTLNAIVSYGERLSSNIVASLIDGARLYDSLTFIKTEKKQCKNLLVSDLTNSLVAEAFKDLTAGAVKVALVPGFISTDVHTGEVTNLGRGGSDYTASIIAAALDAEALEIWTDVDGFMTADPLPQSYTTPSELCGSDGVV
jgi:aspartokinase/homoserine dehydrogenase 1